jgi:uncharacterized protein (TIGR03435 family)
MPIVRKLLLAAVASFALAASAQAPNPTPTPTFDVASVKQNKTERTQHSNVPLDTGNVYSAIDPSDARTSAGGYFVATNQPLWRYIVFAYKLSGTQELALRFSYFDGLKSKAPGWVTGGFDVSADRFNIEARAPDNSTIDQMRLMMQALLADRFHLVVHLETRDAPAFGLLLVRPGAPGPNLQPHPPSDTCPTSTTQPDQPASPSTPSAVGDLPPLCGIIAHVLSSNNPHSSFGGRNIPPSLLTTSLPTMTGMATIPRPVVDQTASSASTTSSFTGTGLPIQILVTLPRPSAEPSRIRLALNSSPPTLPSTSSSSTTSSGLRRISGRGSPAMTRARCRSLPAWCGRPAPGDGSSSWLASTTSLAGS